MHSGVQHREGRLEVGMGGSKQSNQQNLPKVPQLVRGSADSSCKWLLSASKIMCLHLTCHFPMNYIINKTISVRAIQR